MSFDNAIAAKEYPSIAHMLRDQRLCFGKELDKIMEEEVDSWEKVKDKAANILLQKASLEQSISKFRKRLSERIKVKPISVDFQEVAHNYELSFAEKKKDVDNFIAAKKREIETNYL